MTSTTKSMLSKDVFMLDPGIVFLNHGSFGATPRPVFEKYQWWQKELERRPVEFLGRRFANLMHDAREAIAAYVGAGADDLVFVPNATTAVNLVARSVALKPGDEILATDHEYGAMDRTWRFLCRKTGAVYKQQAIPLPVTSAKDFVERMWAGVTARTRVLFLSHITSPTALTFPVRELCLRARQAGIISIVDGAHTVGQIPLDVPDIGADFYTSNLHKWLCCPKGSAFLYARAEMQHLVEPLVVSWGYEAEKPSASRFVDEQEWTGTRDIAAYLTTPDAIQFYEQNHWEEVRRVCHALAQYARDRITGLAGLRPICPDSTEWFMQMAAMELPPCDHEKIKAQLYDEFRIEVPIVKWQGKPYLRVSVQAYNAQEDIEQLVDALAKLFGW